MITNPLYFINMKWQDRRKVLLDIIGDITTEKIVNYRSNLKKIEQLLNDKDVDSLKKSIAARKRKLNHELFKEKDRIYSLKSKLKDIEYRVKTEAQAPFEKLREELSKIKFELNSKENEKQLIFDENQFICPTCKRPFEEKDIEHKKNEMLENFN